MSTRRGKDLAGDFGPEMFPGKYESTQIWEDPDMLDINARAGLMDYAPVSSRLFAHEEARRDTKASGFLNLRHGGKFGSTAQPWASDGHDIQFHDADPRGTSDQQPWSEFRRQAQARHRMFDYRDDGDYSITGGGISPDALYARIRGTQDWLKARWKIFDDALVGFAAGGVGVYDKTSGVYKSEYENSAVGVDGTGMSQTFEDPENRARLTTILSNWVHGGSKAMRVNTTTDHRVKTSAYGKLLAQRGLIDHQTQLRMVADDRKYSTLSSIRSGNKNLVVALDAMTRGDARKRAHDASQAPGQINPNQARERSDANRTHLITGEIMSLLGYTQNDVRFLESMANQNNKQAQHALADLFRMTETVHRTPVFEKMQIRDALLLHGGLQPNAHVSSKDKSVVNPKLIEFMATNAGKSVMPGTNAVARGTLKTGHDYIMESGPILVSKSASQSDQSRNLRAALSTKKSDESKSTVNYKHLVGSGNIGSAIPDREFTESIKAIVAKSRAPEQLRANLDSADIDNDFRNAGTIERHIGKLGNKRPGLNQSHNIQGGMEYVNRI